MATFKKNPFQYGKKIFEDKKSGEPEFSEQEAEEFFKKEYSDKNRGLAYEEFSGLPPAKEPTKPFIFEEPSLEEFEKKLKTRRNKSAPGPNGIPYTIITNGVRRSGEYCLKSWLIYGE